MNIMLKIGVFTAMLSAVFAVPSGTANAAGDECWGVYTACIDAGYDHDLCMDRYYYCYGVIPAKSISATFIANIRS